MPRYFICSSAPRSEHWAGDDTYVEPLIPAIHVSEHTATDTGILDLNGNAIMRHPREMGFGKDID